MIVDPGFPFTKSFSELVDTFEDQLRHGVEQPASTPFTFQETNTTYVLPRSAESVFRVTGLISTRFVTFTQGSDYFFTNGRLIWNANGTLRPDNGSRFEVEYRYRERTSGITDFNPGSVTGTLIRTVARELKLFYDQMDQAYRRAFIDIAEGVALDNVVALLGVIRNPSLKATGHITFYCKRAPSRYIPIPPQTRITDEGGRGFVTLLPGGIEPIQSEFLQQYDGLIEVQNKIDSIDGIWPEADDPNTTPSLATIPYSEDFPFGEQERQIRLAEGVRPTGRLRVRYLPKSITLPIEATVPGPEGNVDAGDIVIMPTPPTGIDGVVNETPLSGGLLPESDDALRDRAKHALERSGNATLNAIKYAVLDIDGVQGVEVVDHSIDDSIPLGEIRVRYAGGDSQLVEQVVNETRAAGIIARLELITSIWIEGTFYVVPSATVPDNTTDSYLEEVVKNITAIAIGQPLSIRRLTALGYPLPGITEVIEAQLNYKKEDPTQPGEYTEQGPITDDPHFIANNELYAVDPSNLLVHYLMALEVAATRTVGDNNEVDLQCLRQSGDPITFRHWTVDVSVNLRARLIRAPDQPAERVGQFTRTLTFDDSALTTLEITPADMPDFREADHTSEVETHIQAAAYATISAATTQVTR